METSRRVQPNSLRLGEKCKCSLGGFGRTLDLQNRNLDRNPLCSTLLNKHHGLVPARPDPQAASASGYPAHARVAPLETLPPADVRQVVRTHHPRPLCTLAPAQARRHRRRRSQAPRTSDQQGRQDCHPVQGDRPGWRDQEGRKPARSWRRLRSRPGAFASLLQTLFTRK